jgi:hypothetical protein
VKLLNSHTVHLLHFAKVEHTLVGDSGDSVISASATSSRLVSDEGTRSAGSKILPTPPSRLDRTHLQTTTTNRNATQDIPMKQKIDPPNLIRQTHHS